MSGLNKETLEEMLRRLKSIKPCPFCGGVAGLGCDIEMIEWYVECLSCGATSDYYVSRHEAIDSWNRRAYEGS